MPGGRGPFQNEWENPFRLKKGLAFTVALGSQPLGASPILRTYIAASKLLGYAVEGPRQDSASVTKMLGYAVEGPRQDSASVTKMLGYAVLQAAPLGRFQQEWPNPLRPRRLRVQGDVWGSGIPSAIPKPPPPFPAEDIPVPERRRALARFEIYSETGGRNLAILAPALTVDTGGISILW